GVPRAVEVWNQYKPVVMLNFENLTDDEIGSILAYIDAVYTGTYGAAQVQPGTEGVATTEPESNKWLYWIVVGVLIALVLLLARIISRLNMVSAIKEGKTDYEGKNFWQTFTSKGIIGVLVFALIILGGY